jgi:serine/threonine protein kinase
MVDPASGPPAPPPAPAADAAALPAGYRINEYDIERTLGGGGFGITYLARDGNLNLPVAIKEYFPSDLATRGANHAVQVRAGNAEAQGQYDWGLERFLDEARALATFRHPNIVRVLRYFRDNGTAYIVMEYESGLALKRWVPQNAPLSQRAVLSIVRPLLDGLEQVHKAGFLHRDIKPDNIYVRADGAPVLLDFGSARRVSANRDLTNIVSPGFAPFEQYHSQGNQGPWTDIYSIGAVLYWMVTGKKPMESASRVKTDGMLPATSLAEAGGFGQPLLEAIDWALQPEEGRRPQSVAEFRRTLQGSDALGDPQAPAQPADRPGIAAAGYAPSVPSAGSGSSSPRRNLLGTILFLDLVGYSIRSVDDQAAIKKLFNELIGKALRGIAEDSRIAIDTGDGAAICFMGDPEEALRSALLMRDLLGQRYGRSMAVRIGVHMGPVRVVSDLNERVNVIGDGINVAQRVMDFAQPNQVLVSRAYYDVISRITDDTADMFMYLGQFEDKHGRIHEIYSADSGAQRNTTRKQGPSTGFTQTVPMKAVQPLDDEAVHEIEVELARLIGPLARVLVAKARPLAGSIEDLREALAPTIQESRTREQFRAGAPGHSHPPNSQSQPVSRPPRSTSQPRSGPSQPPGAGQGGSSSQWGALPASVPLASRSAAAPSQPASGRSGSATTRPIDLPAEELALIEQTLSKFMGPMARMLVKKEIARCGSFRELAAAVAATIDSKEQREEFLKALHKALPRRSF